MRLRFRYVSVSNGRRLPPALPEFDQHLASSKHLGQDGGLLLVRHRMGRIAPKEVTELPRHPLIGLGDVVVTAFSRRSINASTSPTSASNTAKATKPASA